MWGTTIGKGTGLEYFKIFGNVCSIFVRFNRLWRLFCANAGKTTFLILGIFIFRRCHSRYLLEQAGEVL